NWTAPAFLVCGDDLPGVLSGVASSRDAGSPRGWASISFDDRDYSTRVDLAPGYALTLDWDRIDDAWYFRGRDRGAYHTCGDKDYRNCPSIGPILEPYAGKNRARSWSNGTLVFKPDLRAEGGAAGLSETDNLAQEGGILKPKDASRPASFVVEMASPYVVAKASAKIACEDAKIEVSVDGKTWKPAAAGDLTKEVAGSYRYRIRVTFDKPVAGIEVTSIVQHNQEALPYLAPGMNRIAITAANPEALAGAGGKSRLAVTYGYALGFRNVTPEEICERGAEIARAHFAEWSETPIVVRKIVDTFPATLEIPIPTPKGKQPVYPRMLFLRREVLAPGQEPMSVPAPPSAPAAGPDQTLATLPNPWLIGCRKPPARAERPTKSTTTPLPRVSYVNMAGEVFPHQFVKWLKDNSNAWVHLIGVDVAGAGGVRLPAAKDLASAKLAFFVWECHDQADMQVAAVRLKAPFEAGKPYDFKNLGDVAGTTIVRKGKGRDEPFDPPVRYEIDVTKAVRAWANGEPANGLALRIIPNRGVDDGWTVRFTPDRAKPPELMITTYADR
ncbi:MAG: hypothetical protein JXP34_17575, partial [Planctomycetes bacterium]|nr:hypothetical protein [Planctomycetota bacterium]